MLWRITACGLQLKTDFARLRHHPLARRPGRVPFPPTWTVPGASVFNAFYNLAELVSSTQPFTGGGGGGHSGAPGGRRAEAAVPDAGPGRAAPAAFADASKSLYRRGVDAVRLLSELAVDNAGGNVDASVASTADDAVAGGPARRLVGGVPVRNAASPAALFCDVEAPPPAAAQQLAFGVDVTTGRLRRQRRLAQLWERDDNNGGAPMGGAFTDDDYGDGDPSGGAYDGAATTISRRRLWAAAGNRSDAPSHPFAYRTRWPFLRFAVEQWCTLARFTPTALAAFGIVDPKTLLVPDAYAFLRFSEGACSLGWCHMLSSLLAICHLLTPVPTTPPSLFSRRSLPRVVRVDDGAAGVHLVAEPHGDVPADARVVAARVVRHAVRLQRQRRRLPVGGAAARGRQDVLFRAGARLGPAPVRVRGEAAAGPPRAPLRARLVRASTAAGRRGPARGTISYRSSSVTHPHGPRRDRRLTCRVDTRGHFDLGGVYHGSGLSVSPSVRGQFLGRDGNILVREHVGRVNAMHLSRSSGADWLTLVVPPPFPKPQILDGVMVPTAEPLMRFPAVTLLDYVLCVSWQDGSESRDGSLLPRRAKSTLTLTLAPPRPTPTPLPAARTRT